MLTQGDIKFHIILDVYHFRLAGVNKRAAATAGLLPIANCELVIVHTQPGDVTTIRGEAMHRTEFIIISYYSALFLH